MAIHGLKRASGVVLTQANMGLITEKTLKESQIKSNPKMQESIY